jgi:hypothetical protein
LILSQIHPRLGCLRLLSLLGVFASALSFASSTRAATLTVCKSGCTDSNIQAAVTAAHAGDTVKVSPISSLVPYTQQVTVDKQITLEGNPSGLRPVLTFAPSSFGQPTLAFTSAAAGSTLRHMVVRSTGSTSNDAIDFHQAAGTITDVSATATLDALLVDASGVTVGPNISASSTGTDGCALSLDGSITATGVTATASGGSAASGLISGGATVSDSTFSATGGSSSIGLYLSGATAVRVAATGETGITGSNASVTDSLAVGTQSEGIDAISGAPLQLRNVTAISGGSGAPGIVAESGSSHSGPGAIVAKNMIVRGGPGGTDVVANPPSSGGVGSVEIGYSNFVSASAGVDTSSIGHNQSGDPLFVDGVVGASQNFHLQDTSPVIGAGTIDAMTGKSDLDGKPRPAAGDSEPSMGAYEPTVQTLTVTVSGGGSVTGERINCPGTCSASYLAGSQVTLTPAAGSGSVFSGWSGSCSGSGACQVTMNGDLPVTATFTGVAVPSNTALPLIAGTAVVGGTLVASDGTWTASPTSFAYQWQDCDAAGNNCISVPGATTSTDKLTTGDVGHALRIVVTARNAIASQSATSAHTATVARPSPTTRAPTLSHVHLTRSKFMAKKGTTVTAKLSQAATVNVLVTQARHGRKVNGHCKPGAKRGKLCTLTVRSAKLAFHGVSGSDRFTLLIRKLAPGHYSATITARAAGESSKPVTLTFTIERPKAK